MKFRIVGQPIQNTVISGINAIISRKFMKVLEMDENTQPNINVRNCALAAGHSLSSHNICDPSHPGRSGVPNVRGGGVPNGRGGHREESNILTNIRRFYMPQNMYYSNNNNYNVSFSSERSTDAQNNRDLAAQQRETLLKFRKWVNVSPETDAPGAPFTLLNYNVLAQDLLQENAYLYKNHSARACLWETRWNNIYSEIQAYNADIICLQEVQRSHLNDYYKKLEHIGYVGVYKKRTGVRTDGCAIYYKKSQFKMVENTTVEFNQGGSALDRENVAIIARFAPKERPQAEFVVATTHLLYNPRRMDVRLAQTQVLLAEIERIAFNSSANGYVPVIITGDFNSKPDSAVYKLIVDGRLRYENLSKRTLVPVGGNSSIINGKFLISPHLKITDECQHYEIVRRRAQGVHLTRSEEAPLINLRHSKARQHILEPFAGDARLFETGTLTHKFSFLSAFKHRQNSDFEGTTHQNEWITVDYIFYSGKPNKTEDKLQLISNYRIPTTTELREIKFIPNFVIGSDHLPLLSKFKLLY